MADANQQQEPTPPQAPADQPSSVAPAAPASTYPPIGVIEGQHSHNPKGVVRNDKGK